MPRLRRTVLTIPFLQLLRPTLIHIRHLHNLLLLFRALDRVANPRMTVLHLLLDNSKIAAQLLEAEDALIGRKLLSILADKLDVRSLQGAVRGLAGIRTVDEATGVELSVASLGDVPTVGQYCISLSSACEQDA